MRIIFDAASKASSRRVDENGFLHISACPITSHGVFDYARCELGNAVGDGDPNQLFKVLRDLSVVTLPEFIASCQNLPLIDDHTYIEGVIVDSLETEASGVDPAKKGVSGVLTNVRYDEASGWVVGDLAIYARQMIRQVLADEKTELSLGFTCVFTPVEGESYAVTQTAMMGNHLALVDRARVPGARVLDSAFSDPSSEDDSMTTKAKAAKAKVRALDSSAVDKLRELLLPALQQFLTEEAAEPEHQEPTDPAVVANAATTEEPTDPAVPADPTAADPAAVDPAAVDPDKAAAEDDGDDAIVQLLQQLLAALKPAEAAPAEATGDEDPDAEDPAVKKTEDNAVDPSVESPMTMDAMFKAVAERDVVYNRVSKIVGAFDHSAMTAAKVAQFGVKELKLKCAPGQEMVALDAYLSGVEAATAKAAVKTNVGDGIASSSELDAYLAKKS